MFARRFAIVSVAAVLLGLVAVGGPSRAASSGVTYYSGQYLVDADGLVIFATNTSRSPKTFTSRFFQQDGTEYSDSMATPATIPPGATFGRNFFCAPDETAPCYVRFVIKANSGAVVPSATFDPGGVLAEAYINPGDFIKR